MDVNRDLVWKVLLSHYQLEQQKVRIGIASNAPDFVQNGKARAGLLLRMMEEMQLAPVGYATDEMKKLEEKIKKGQQNHEYS